MPIINHIKNNDLLYFRQNANERTYAMYGRLRQNATLT